MRNNGVFQSKISEKNGLVFYFTRLFTVWIKWKQLDSHICILSVVASHVYVVGKKRIFHPPEPSLGTHRAYSTTLWELLAHLTAELQLRIVC